MCFRWLLKVQCMVMSIIIYDQCMKLNNNIDGTHVSVPFIKHYVENAY